MGGQSSATEHLSVNGYDREYLSSHSGVVRTWSFDVSQEFGQ